MAERYKVRFPDAPTLRSALAARDASRFLKVVNEKRRYVAVELSDEHARDATARRDFTDLLEAWRRRGAEVLGDPHYDLELPTTCDRQEPDDPEAPSLDQVLARIRAPAAWATSRGAGTLIAIVDTGVDVRCGEFPPPRRIGGWAPIGEDPWADRDGHGTMSATVAAGTRAAGAPFDGVAPDAAVASCRTSFTDGELGAIYDHLIALRQQGHRVIASNSFGKNQGHPPPAPDFPEFYAALEEALGAGVIVCFSAGNNHDDANGDPAACEPSTIWEPHKCRDDVLTVGVSDLDDRMWNYSSRGPGQYFGDPGSGRKPDVVAPTPRRGRIFCGATIRTWPKGWGTSGAAPQVAGLAALVWSAAPDMRPADVRAAIRSTATSLGLDANCQGAGLIDCAAAVRMASSRRPSPV